MSDGPIPAEEADETRTSGIDLFRAQAAVERNAGGLGTVLLEPRVSLKISALVAGVAAVALVCMLAFGSYTRKERIKGWLVPEKGIVRVVPAQSGIVMRLAVTEGALVEKGAVLAVLSTDVSSEALGATATAVVRQMEARRATLQVQRQSERDLLRQQTEETTARLDGLRGESRLLEGEIATQNERLRLAGSALKRAQTLQAKGAITRTALEAVEADHLDQSAKLQSLQRGLSQVSRDIAASESALAGLPVQDSIKSAEIDRNTAALDQEIAEAEAKREIVVTAPQAGRVTSIQTEVGGTASPSVPLLSIVPEGSVLQAQLFAPSRAIGSVRPEQAVQLRFQSFPYQHFGFYAGSVETISLSATSPAELPQQLSGLSAFYGTTEPFYRITVDLARQDVTAYGRQVPLQPGMQLEADVMVERHRLFQWILYPLFSRMGHWAG